MTGKKGMGHTYYTVEYKTEIIKRIMNGEITLKGFCRNIRSIVKRLKL